MIDRRELDAVRDVVHALLADRAAGDPGTLWAALQDLGLVELVLPEALGGMGGGGAAIAEVARVSGALPTPVPLAETVCLAGWLVSLGLPVPTAEQLPLTACAAPGAVRLRVSGTGDGLVVAGELDRVPWVGSARTVVVGHEDRVLLLSTADLKIEPGTDVAGDDRGGVLVPELRLAADRWTTLPAAREVVHRRAAAARVLALGGAADRALELTVEHCRTRIQFGRPLAQFQAVGQLLARMAAGVAVLQAAGHLVATALDDDEPDPLESAVAVGIPAATSVAAVAHQLHGAIGLTREHPLHLSTTRLTAWAGELGPERYWASRLGSRLLTAPGDPWHRLVKA
ncbi:acyl-CoA dehydrogenase family protein [Pseudonocardia ailaonensis]|uniref:Acyl-CoA dehydrogenase family protein n=1 Tax=Pseudonocardia ailaonensis TaxID=367279 RepID=A0ABN2NL98_9PSEU